MKKILRDTLTAVLFTLLSPFFLAGVLWALEWGLLVHGQSLLSLDRPDDFE